jgi:predicted DNA-binding protein with PD1-like motif
MKVFPAREGFLIRLMKGEEIHESLTAYAAKHGITGATVSGIGAVRNVEVGFFNSKKRGYDRLEINEDTELLSLTGNLCLREGKPFLHAHVVLMKADFSVCGGHLFRGEVSVTGEFAVRQADLSLTRARDETVGLDLLEAGDL